MKTSLTVILTTGAALLLGSLAVPARADILYVANEGNNTIEKFSASGSDLGTFATNPVFGAAPSGLAFDSAANLYVAYPNITTNMAKFSAAGTYLFGFGWPALSYAQGIAFDGAGNLYVADAVHNTIEKFSATGTDLGTFASSGLNLPRGIAFDSAGNLYAANEGDNSIEEFSPAGTDLGAFASSPSAQLSFPFGLAFDGAGNLYVANVGLREIEKFSATGVDLGAFASTGTTPEGLAFDSAGNLYVACQGGPVIEKFTPDGAGSVFASSGVNGPTFLAFTDDAGNPLPLPPPPAFLHTPPVLTPVANQTINAGQTLLVTNVAIDPDVPPLTLTFSLMSGPGAINSTNGIFSWRPLVSQANTTNLVMVEAADSGTPSLSATNSFDVIVNPLILPNVSSITTSGGQVALVVTGTEGPDYTLLTSTNLTDPVPDWQILLETNSPVTPVTLVVPITADPARFYRIQIGP